VLQNWNHLSQEVTEADTINTFKSRLENSTRFGTKKMMLLNPTASSSSSSSRLLQECPSVRLVCLSHSWAVLKQLDWIEMPFCNAQRLALANSMPYCVRWGPDLHPRPPGRGNFGGGRSPPLWSVGITHDNAVAHGDKMTWLVPFKLGTILQLDHLQRWAWPYNVIRPMPLVLGRQAEPDSDWLAQCRWPQSTASFFTIFNWISRLLIDRLDLFPWG